MGSNKQGSKQVIIVLSQWAVEKLNTARGTAECCIAASLATHMTVEVARISEGKIFV